MATAAASPSAAPTLNGRLAAPPSPATAVFHSTTTYTSHTPGQAARKTSSAHSPLLRPSTPPALGVRTAAGGAQQQPTHHPGCVLCGYVASAQAQEQFPSAPYAPASPASNAIPLPSPARSSTPDVYRAGPSNPAASARMPSSPTLRPLRLPGNDVLVSGHRIIYRDDFVTIYPAEGKEALCPNGRHLIIVLNNHHTSVYEFGAGDVPLISHMIKTAHRLLLSRQPPMGSTPERIFTDKDVRVGFVNGMPTDPRSPHAHLHAHAFLGPFDKTLPGSTLWRRNVVFGTLNWWALEDLRAEIREESSNNRVKSGYDDRYNSPIDKVPDAGAVEGFANVLDPDAYADDSPRGSKSLGRKDSAASTATVKPGNGNGSGSPISPVARHHRGNSGRTGSSASTNTVSSGTHSSAS